MGTLYLVATPIGNLEDITLRALRILREVPLIAAEDTRHTRKLLSHFGISTPALSYHEHSGPARTDTVLSALLQGDVALVSDAGTPVISDPGEELVRAALAAGHAVVPIPGPVAAVSALIASGLPADQFTYLGFLPRRASERQAILEGVRDEPRTLVLYEAPHRLRETLADLLRVLGNRPACAARELTKLHEEFIRGPLDELRQHFAETTPRGEFTVMVGGAPLGASRNANHAPARQHSADALLRRLLAEGRSTRDAVDQVAEATGLPRRDLYHRALHLSDEEPPAD